MAATFTEVSSLNSAVYDQDLPGRRITCIGTLNLGTHASGGVAVTAAIVNAGISNTDHHFGTIDYIEILGRSVDLTCSARYVRSSGKVQVGLEDGTSGVVADASTADLSGAGKTFDVKVIGTRAEY